MGQTRVKENGVYKTKAINRGDGVLLEKIEINNEFCENHDIIIYRGIRKCQTCGLVFGPSFNINSQNKNCL